jgi:hypothetical protein
VNIVIKEKKFDRDMYKVRADEALNFYLRGRYRNRDAFRGIIAGLCENAYQRGLRDGRNEKV